LSVGLFGRGCDSSPLTGHLPVFGVAAAVDYFDDHLVCAGLGDGAFDDGDLGAGGDESFLHFVCLLMNDLV
jgi:hypothetical protein